MDPRYSLIIPAHNEEKLLGRLLASVAVARETYGPPEAVEVIVADNVSTDATARIAREHGCQVVAVEKRVIGAVRNGGARVARGEILAFIDSDSVVHPRTFIEIDRALATGRVVGGSTGVTMERWSLGIAVTYALMVSVVWITGMDTGVVFCRRRDFEEIGGYDEDRLVAEDVKFMLAMRRLGRTRGQRLARVTTAKAVTSTRKFDEFGDWHYFPMALHGLRYMRTGTHTEFTERYWYRPKR
jgi:glycosyltransferase involved in cell wall biosynthesis